MYTQVLYLGCIPGLYTQAVYPLYTQAVYPLYILYLLGSNNVVEYTFVVGSSEHVICFDELSVLTCSLTQGVSTRSKHIQPRLVFQYRLCKCIKLCFRLDTAAIWGSWFGRGNCLHHFWECESHITRPKVCTVIVCHVNSSIATSTCTCNLCCIYRATQPCILGNSHSLTVIFTRKYY